ncbi:MAG TPA: prolyl oligopeptidase family serine peptidase, partial [Candidatus Cryptobacteroides sp.]|nr:prolyl oligopeptidase family serine peptidase [Candidatus Cryptobacteroides sp.]
KRHGKYYYSRNDGLQNQSVLYVTDEPGTPGKVLLDPNTLSDDGTVAYTGSSISKDGKYMAYTISRSGSDWTEIYVLDLQSGKHLEDHIVWGKFTDAAWHGDGFYYSAYDAPSERAYSGKNELHKIYYHKIGTPQSEDKLYFSNPKYPLRFYSVSLNDEESMMFLYESGMGNGNLLYVKDLTKKNAPFVKMVDDYELQYSPIGTVGKRIYLYTNYGASMGRIMVADISKPGLENWKEVLGESKDAIDGVSIIGGKLIVTYLADACSRAALFDLDGKFIRDIDLPGIGSVYFAGVQDEPDCYYSFTSITSPATIYKYDLDSGESSLYVQPKLAFNPDDFTTEEIFYPSKDGTQIPMFITYKKGLKLNGKNPTLLYGYGGFNVSMTPYFTPRRIPFLENGGIYAQPSIRGGGEYGKEWHVAGTKMQKQNVFDDFIAAAEWLIANKYTDSKHIAIMGGSNGGLLVGACMTQRPELFRVVISQVGVMDMLRYHKFTIGWNWARDFGTSEESQEMFEYLYGYSPLHNLKPGVAYPATLITTADHDDRVVPAHSFKFAATLQDCQAGPAPCLIRVDVKAGHGSGKPVSMQIDEYTDIYSFIIYNMPGGKY